jgi:hypothetical protein
MRYKEKKKQEEMKLINNISAQKKMAILKAKGKSEIEKKPNQQQQPAPVNKNIQNEDLKLNHEFFVRLAEFMFNQDITLYEIIHKKIFDKMFNGREYELINSRHFFRLFEEKGFKASKEEMKAVISLLKAPHFIDVLEVSKISKILEELDIKEDIPNPSK